MIRNDHPEPRAERIDEPARAGVAVAAACAWSSEKARLPG
jgi:hypothetical protein